MATDHYKFIVLFKSLPGKEQALKDCFKPIIEVALKTPGCLAHELHQRLDNPSEFMFYEVWTNKEAHQQHIARSIVQEWRATLDIYLEKQYPVSYWELVNS